MRRFLILFFFFLSLLLRTNECNEQIHTTERISYIPCSLFMPLRASGSLLCRRIAATCEVASLSCSHSSSLITQQRTFFEDSAEVFKFRNSEASEVRRRNPGVSLGSKAVEREYLRTEQQKLVDQDKMTDWGQFYRVTAVIILLYTALELSVLWGEPFEPTEYTPYTKDPTKQSSPS